WRSPNSDELPRFIAAIRRGFFLALAGMAATAASRAAQPPELAEALKRLGIQSSYSWEIINGDPGPVAQRSQTRRGAVTVVHQNLAPHIRGRLSTSGEAFIEREWPDGLRLDVLVAADGSMVTNTPDGWMTSQEI